MDERGTIAGVMAAGRVIRIACRRTHEGLKSRRACKAATPLDVRTLAALYGPACPVAELERKLHCPTCGSRQIALEIVVAAASTLGAGTLGEAPEARFSFACPACGRHGRYRRETLIEKLGGAIGVAELPAALARANGCVLLATGRCRVRFDLGAMYRDAAGGRPAR